MDKKILLSSLVVLTVLLTCNVSNAAPAAPQKKAITNVKTEQAVTEPLQRKLPPPEFKKGEHPKFDHFKGHPEMQPFFKSKEEMEAKKAEIDKRLNLTEQQKQKLEKNKEKDKAKIKPIMEKIGDKKKELHEIYHDTTLTQEQKDKKAEAVKKDLNKLRTQADNCRKQNMKNFEAVLTKDQKAEFEKIKQEQKAEMEKRRVEFEQKKEEFKKQHPEFKGAPPVRPLPVPKHEVKK